MMYFTKDKVPLSQNWKKEGKKIAFINTVEILDCYLFLRHI